MSESTKVTKKRKRESTIIYGRPQIFFQGGNVDISFTIFKLLTISVPLRQFYTEPVFVLVSIIILGLSNWRFQWITNFVNYIISIQSYQNTSKMHISFKYLLVCVLLCWFGMLQVRKKEISLRNSSGGSEYLRPLEGTLLTMQCKWTFTKRFILSTWQRKCPHVTVTITKNASLAAIARYISITTIYTVGYQQIFNVGHFFTSKHCHEL